MLVFRYTQIPFLTPLFSCPTMKHTTAAVLLSMSAPAYSAVYKRQIAGINWQSCDELNELVTASNGVEGEPVQCANIDVPLDYTLDDSEPLQLDLFRVEATEEPVLGSVLINFGGPGGTGAENLPLLAAQARANIGPQWNLVSWE
jgi:hypothetical protein